MRNMSFAIKYIFFTVLLLCTITISNVQAYSSLELNLPSGLYQHQYNNLRSKQVRYDSPDSHPVVEWSISLPGLFPSQHLVDDQGNIWLSNDRPLRDSRHLSLMQISKEGKMIPLRDRYSLTYTPPVLITDKMVLFLNHRELICLDFGGNVVWRNRSLTSNHLRHKACLISKNRLMIPVGDRNTGQFNIYSITSGELLESLRFQDWDDNNRDSFPVELEDGGWLGFESSSIVKYDSNLDKEWKIENMQITFNWNVALVCENLLLIGENSSLIAVNVNDGLELWRRDDIGFAIPIGIIDDNNVLIGHSSTIRLMDKEGRDIWFKNLPFSCYFYNAVVYNDGSVLFPSSYGIGLIDKDGTLIWNLNLNDSNIPYISMAACELSPAPEDRIIISYVDFRDNEQPIKIVSLTTKERPLEK